MCVTEEMSEIWVGMPLIFGLTCVLYLASLGAQALGYCDHPAFLLLPKDLALPWVEKCCSNSLSFS